MEIRLPPTDPRGRALLFALECSRALAEAGEVEPLVELVPRLAVERAGYLAAAVLAQAEGEALAELAIASAHAGADGWQGWASSLARHPWPRAVLKDGLPSVRGAHGGGAADPVLLGAARAALALPLGADEPAAGLLVLVGEADAFGELELGEFASLAHDLRGGLELLRERSALRQAEARAGHLTSALHRRLRDSEARFRATFENAGVGRALVVPSGRFRLVNEALCDMLGYPSSELERRTFRDITHADDLAKSVAVMTSMLAGERSSARFEKRCVHRDGRVVWVDLSSTLVLDAAGVPVHFVVDMVDVSERKHAEEALRSSEEQYRTVVENLQDLIYSVDDDGRLEFVSPSVTRYGYTTAELIGRPFVDFLHADDRGAAAAMYRAAIGGEPQAHELRIVAKDGEVFVARITARRRLLHGRAAGVSGLVVDVTEQRRTEEQLRQAQKLEAVAVLAGGLAHDFNNLLTVVNSYADLAMAALPGADPVCADLLEIRAAGTRAASLTRKLLAFARRQVLSLELIDVNVVLRELEPMLTRLLGEAIAFEMNLDDGLRPVRADRVQLEQVVLNLIINAREAMPVGGRIVVETAECSRLPSSVAPEADGCVVLSVSDTGHGMDEATAARVFEPFFTTKKGGTGLGLSTVHGIVCQSGGDLQVESRPGRGAKFSVFLPCTGGQARRERPSQPPASAAGHETILLVEDDESVRPLARRILVGAGFEVLTAANAGEALLLHERHSARISLLITDVVMPQMNGPELAARLTAEHPELRTLFMSGYAHEARLPDEGHVRNFLPKPFSARELVARAREMLDAPRLAR